MNVVITGANSGLGLGFVSHYLDEGAEVWACYRADNSALQAIASNRLYLVQWDVTEAAPRKGQGSAPFPDAVDLLINCAGIYGPKKESGQALTSVTAQTMQEVFDIDAVGPLRVVQYLLPKILKAKGRVANLSSKMGSTGDNSSGGCYAYRAAKAALVIMSKSMAVDLGPRGVQVITLHPGWVRTKMTDHTGLIDVAESVAGMAKVIREIDRYEPGAFVAFDGRIVPY
jgi:NAD(P)-dependent dehydrogenase (short-subunit alcohol dehydrogenase family)